MEWNVAISKQLQNHAWRWQWIELTTQQHFELLETSLYLPEAPRKPGNCHIDSRNCHVQFNFSCHGHFFTYTRPIMSYAMRFSWKRAGRTCMYRYTPLQLGLYVPTITTLVQRWQIVKPEGAGIHPHCSPVLHGQWEDLIVLVGEGVLWPVRVLTGRLWGVGIPERR